MALALWLQPLTAFFFFHLNPVFLQVWLRTGASVGAVCYWFMPGTHIQKSRVRVWKFSQHFDIALTSKLQAHNNFLIDSFLLCHTKVLHHSRLEITHPPAILPPKEQNWFFAMDSLRSTVLSVSGP